jgi:hypothetical protein
MFPSHANDSVIYQRTCIIEHGGWFVINPASYCGGPGSSLNSEVVVLNEDFCRLIILATAMPVLYLKLGRDPSFHIRSVLHSLTTVIDAVSTECSQRAEDGSVI